MTKRDNLGRLQDILDATTRIQAYMKGTVQRKFVLDLMRQDAIVRQIEVIGEAARNISRSSRKTTPKSLGRK